MGVEGTAGLEIEGEWVMVDSLGVEKLALGKGMITVI